VARGWESKSVEEQISEREAEAQSAGKPKLSRHQLEQRAKREGMLLARARTLSSLETTRDERYRCMLERALAHLDSQIAEIDSDIE